MKKLFKILAVAAIAVAAAIACVFVGCKKDSGGDNKADYNFTIVYEGGAKDGQPVNGQTDGHLEGGKVLTQICVTQCMGLNMANIYPDANGKLSLSQAQVNEIIGSDTDVTEFVFHVLHVTGYKSDCEIEVNGKGDYTVKVTVS